MFRNLDCSWGSVLNTGTSYISGVVWYDVRVLFDTGDFQGSASVTDILVNITVYSAILCLPVVLCDANGISSSCGAQATTITSYR